MSELGLLERYRAETVERRLRLFGAGKPVILANKPMSYSGRVTGRMWLGIDSRGLNRPVTAAEIIAAVLSVTGVCRKDFIGEARAHPYITARHLASFFMRHHTRLSYPQIAHFTGRKDHSTAIHAVRCVMERPEFYTPLLASVAALLRIDPPKEGLSW